MAAAAAATLLPSALQNILQEIVHRANLSGASIRAVLLSTSEGVPLGRVYAGPPEGLFRSTQQGGVRESDGGAVAPLPPPPMHEDVLVSMESVWAPAAKQIPMLGLDKLKQVTAIYDHGTVIHVYQAPIVMTVLSGPQANLGAIRSTAIPLLQEALEPLRTTLVNSLKPDWQEEEDPNAYPSGAAAGPY